MRFRLPTSRMITSMAFSTSTPGSVTRRSRLPWRAKMSTPSSSSSSRIALEMPGCEVNSALAVSVRFRLRRTASWTNRNWCRFIFRCNLWIARIISLRVCGRGEQLAGGVGHRGDHRVEFADGGVQLPAHAWVRRREFIEQLGQVLAHVAAGAEEERQHVDAGAA